MIALNQVLIKRPPFPIAILEKVDKILRKTPIIAFVVHQRVGRSDPDGAGKFLSCSLSGLHLWHEFERGHLEIGLWTAFEYCTSL